MVPKDHFRVIDRKIQLLENGIFQTPVPTEQGSISIANEETEIDEVAVLQYRQDAIRSLAADRDLVAVLLFGSHQNPLCKWLAVRAGLDHTFFP